MKLKQLKNYLFIGVAIFVLFLFAFITVKTPLAGDDWGYALNGMNGNPFLIAIHFYQIHSGRFLSELYGFIVAPNKWIWNILNPLIFTGTFLCMYFIIRPKKNHVLILLSILAVMLSVDDNLRMETYSWLMGTTYTIPLFMSLLYFLIIQRLIEKVLLTKIHLKKQLLWRYLVTNALLLCIGLMMENIAATMIVATLILAIYAFCAQRRIFPLFVSNVIFSVGSFIILRMSPGATLRLTEQHGAWASMNLIEKIASGYTKFLDYSFIRNNYMILILAIALILLVLCNHQYLKRKIFSIAGIGFQCLAVVAVFSFVLPAGLQFLNESTSLFSQLFWPLYIVIDFLILYFYLDKMERDPAIFYLMIAGTSTLVMMYSPIFGSRSAVYLVYYIIVVIGFVLKETNIYRWVSIVVCCVLALIVADRTNEYIYKYKLVAKVQDYRLEIYEYYRHNPNDTEVWIPRFPPYTIHSADVEKENTYHMETFRDYYQLPQDPEDITFGWMEEYY